jgi:hypothetical protein
MAILIRVASSKLNASHRSLPNVNCSWESEDPLSPLSNIVGGDGVIVSQARKDNLGAQDNNVCIDHCSGYGFNYAGTDYGFNCGKAPLFGISQLFVDDRVN